MNKIIENCLFETNPISFNEIKREAMFFTFSYVGRNIIKSDIFNIAKNYVKRNDKHLEIFRLPIQDDNLCGFTCIKKGIFFMVINSSLPLNKQIIASCHELYHIYNYIFHEDKSLLYKGSLLTYEHIDQLAIENEDKQANAFAGQLLAPASSIIEQMDIYQLDRNDITPKTIITLMEIFAIPYKAIVLRLYEESLITKRRAELLFQQEPTIQHDQQLSQSIIDFGDIPTLIKENEFNLPITRIEEDKKTLNNITNLLDKKT